MKSSKKQEKKKNLQKNKYDQLSSIYNRAKQSQQTDPECFSPTDKRACCEMDSCFRHLNSTQLGPARVTVRTRAVTTEAINKLKWACLGPLPSPCSSSTFLTIQSPTSASKNKSAACKSFKHF